ncbi:MAG TPA: hypothetical protein VFM51_12175 [Solirubrobacterales bacterium]|nr:hypothetical protein [Solirubrobacterales bacterium]
MKYLKMLSLAAVAAMALMAFGAGTASATKLYKHTTALGVGTEITASLASGTSSRLTTTGGTTLNTCTSSSVAGEIENAGGASATVEGNVEPENLTWTNCSTGSVTTTVGGNLVIHHIAGTTNGTLTAEDFEVTVDTFFGPCTYVAGEGTHLGTLTGNSSTSGHATMDINAIVTRKAEDPDDGTCPSSARWVGTYTVTSPTGLNVEAS